MIIGSREKSSAVNNEVNIKNVFKSTEEQARFFITVSVRKKQFVSLLVPKGDDFK